MIYKVFYQESKVSPRREQTRSLYMEVEAESELQGRIIARELVEKHTHNTISNLSNFYPKASPI